jgi:arylsulfatase A-like enzyme
MERLAGQGIRFTNAYACPLCSPTRISIMTGQNAARHRVTQWTLRPGSDPSQSAQGMQSPAWNINGLQPGYLTLPELLRRAGYRTIHAGKAHFAARGTEGEDPCRQGFDVNIAGHAAGGPGSYHGTKNFSAAWRKGDRIWDVPGLDAYHGKKINLTEAITIEANKRIEEAVKLEKPFYLYMSHYAVHAPLEPDERFVQRYLDQGADRSEAIYASMVESMDDSLGRILDKLDALGVAENTIVLFASDNGGLSHGPRGKTPMGTGHYTHNGPLRSGKCSAYEGGIRVPMIVSWAGPDPAQPNQERIPIKRGSTCDQPVICDDYLPTLCRWAGVEDVERLVPVLDGHDITGYVTGQEGFHRPGELVFHYPHFINYSESTVRQGYGPFSAMRDGSWKVIYFYDRKKWELYDLSTDIGEQNDLASARPERLHELAGKLVSRLKSMNAQYPMVTETGKQAAIKLPE